MNRITVGLGDRSYDIVIETGALGHAGAHLKPLTKTGRIIVVTDANVAPLHLATLTESATAAGLQVQSIILPPGEGTKNWAQLTKPQPRARLRRLATACVRCWMWTAPAKNPAGHNPPC